MFYVGHLYLEICANPVYHLVWTKPKGDESNWSTLRAMRFTQQWNHCQSGHYIFFLILWVSDHGKEPCLYCLTHILLRGRGMDLMTPFIYFVAFNSVGRTSLFTWLCLTLMFNDKGEKIGKITLASKNPEHDQISRDPNIINTYHLGD